MSAQSIYKGTILEDVYVPRKFNTDTYTEVDHVISAEQQAVIDCCAKDIEAGANDNGKLKAYIVDTLLGVGGAAISFILPEIGIALSAVSLLNSLRLNSEEKKEQIRKKLEAEIAVYRKDFAAYKEMHEQLLKEAAHNVLMINRKKTISKECLLMDLKDMLALMGVQSTYSDFISEFLDLSKFPVNEKYDMNTERIDDSIKSFGKFINNLSDSLKDVKKFKKELEDTEIEIKHNQNEMTADLLQLDCFAQALDNIAKIYQAIVDALKPILRKQMKEMATKYNFDMKAVPKEEKVKLNKVKDMLKDIAEHVILKDSEDMVDCAINMSNDLSDKYEDLKRSILDLVA